MGTVHKIGDDYIVEFFARGLRYQRNGGKSEAKAKRLLEDIETKIQNGEMLIADNNIEIAAFFKKLTPHLRSEHSPKTLSRYVSVIEHFQEFCREVLPSRSKLSQVTPSVIEEYRAALSRNDDKDTPRIKPKVINLTLYLLRDILDHAIKWGHINDNPTLHVRFIEISHQNSPQTLSEENVKDLLDQPSSQLKDIVILFLRTGLRCDELIGLKWKDVDLKNNILKVETDTQVSNDAQQTRLVPMDNEVVSIFRSYERNKTNKKYVFTDDSGQLLDKIQLTEDCRNLAKQIGLNGRAVFNMFRNTFAKDVLKKGASLVDLYKLLGFSDIARILRYEGSLGIKKFQHR